MIPTRSTKAGGLTPATPGRHRGRCRGLYRSTKAGGLTPATPASRPSPGWRSAALNEGRGANPGDTATSRRSRCRRSTLNEGRGANPGDTPSGRCSRTRPSTLNEGRGANPGDTPNLGGVGRKREESAAGLAQIRATPPRMSLRLGLGSGSRRESKRFRRDHRTFAAQSNDPGIAQPVRPGAPEPEACVVDAAIEPIYD